MELIDLQCEIEQKYAKKHVDARIRQEIEQNPDMAVKIRDGAERLRNWIEGTYYDSKMKRLSQLKKLDLERLVHEIFVGIAHFLVPTLYTNAVAQLAGRLGFDDKRDSIVTMGEIVAILCLTDAFDITKDGPQASLKLESRIPLSEECIQYILNTRYLPPMLCEPKELTNNRESGYLTFNDSRILQTGNHHEGNICLDVLNTMNHVALRLDTEFLSTIEEDPNSEFTVEKAQESALKEGKVLSAHEALEIVEQQKQNWQVFKKQSYQFYSLISKCGNRFHLTHKVDKRGRVYAQGYNINTQGTAFKKSCIEFADQEVVNGVPPQYNKQVTLTS